MENNEILEKWTKHLNDIGCHIDGEEWYVNTLTDNIVKILPNLYKGITTKILSIVFDNTVITFEPDEEKYLKDNGFEELFPKQAPAPAAATSHAPNQLNALIAKICQVIKGKQLSGKDLDKVIQSQVSIDSIPVPANVGYDDTELNSIVRTTDYPEFETDEKGKTRNKDGILKCAIAKYGEAKVYHYSNLLRFIGASLRMFDPTSAPATV
jgi:hypothetical protein